MSEDIEFKGLTWTTELVESDRRTTMYKDRVVSVSMERNECDDEEWDFAIDGNYSGYGYSTMEIAMTAALDEVDERGEE
jgi:hypothetical protein